MNDLNDMQKRIDQLERDLDSLNSEYYRNNFSGRQDFPKYSDFKTMVKLPSYSARPATCQVGEVIESGGKLYICSAANTWTVAGTQV